MWKEKLWQVFLVAILGLVLTMCSRSGGNNNSSTSSNANAEETTTVSVSSMPSLNVESLPNMTITLDNSSATPVAVTALPVVILDNSSTFSVSVVNAGPNAITHTMYCNSPQWDSTSATFTYYYCDASDNTVLGTNGSISHDAALAAGWKLVGPACGTGSTSIQCVLFHK